MNSTAAPYSEEPLMQFRQVMHEHTEPVEVRPQMGLCPAGYENKARRWVRSVQQKWRVGSFHGQAGIPGASISFIEEWRDLPIVEAKDA